MHRNCEPPTYGGSHFRHDHELDIRPFNWLLYMDEMIARS